MAQPDTTLCQCLYVVNKQAKQARDKAQEAYQDGQYNVATDARKRKERLYKLKARVLDSISAAASKTALHDISSTTYYYLVFEGDGKEWGFHAPTDAVDLSGAPSTSKALDDFDSDATMTALTPSDLDVEPVSYLEQHVRQNASLDERLEQTFA